MDRDHLINSLILDETVTLENLAESKWISLLAETRDKRNFTFKTFGLSKVEREVEIDNVERVFKD